MPRTVFRYEIKENKARLAAMRELLKEIGSKNYWRAVADCGDIYMQQKPLGVKGHYLEYECDTGEMYLYYRYSGGSLIKIMQINGYWKVPVEGWDMIQDFRRP